MLSSKNINIKYVTYFIKAILNQPYLERQFKLTVVAISLIEILVRENKKLWFL